MSSNFQKNGAMNMALISLPPIPQNENSISKSKNDRTNQKVDQVPTPEQWHSLMGYLNYMQQRFRFFALKSTSLQELFHVFHKYQGTIYLTSDEYEVQERGAEANKSRLQFSFSSLGHSLNASNIGLNAHHASAIPMMHQSNLNSSLLASKMEPKLNLVQNQIQTESLVDFQQQPGILIQNKNEVDRPLKMGVAQQNESNFMCEKALKKRFIGTVDINQIELAHEPPNNMVLPTNMNNFSIFSGNDQKTGKKPKSEFHQETIKESRKEQKREHKKESRKSSKKETRKKSKKEKKEPKEKKRVSEKNNTGGQFIQPFFQSQSIKGDMSRVKPRYEESYLQGPKSHTASRMTKTTNMESESYGQLGRLKPVDEHKLSTRQSVQTPILFYQFPQKKGRPRSPISGNSGLNNQVIKAEFMMKASKYAAEGMKFDRNAGLRPTSNLSHAVHALVTPKGVPRYSYSSSKIGSSIPASRATLRWEDGQKNSQIVNASKYSHVESSYAQSNLPTYLKDDGIEAIEPEKKKKIKGADDRVFWERKPKALGGISQREKAYREDCLNNMRRALGAYAAKAEYGSDQSPSEEESQKSEASFEDEEEEKEEDEESEEGNLHHQHYTEKEIGPGSGSESNSPRSSRAHGRPPISRRDYQTEEERFEHYGSSEPAPSYRQNPFLNNLTQGPPSSHRPRPMNDPALMGSAQARIKF